MATISRLVTDPRCRKQDRSVLAVALHMPRSRPLLRRPRLPGGFYRPHKHASYRIAATRVTSIWNSRSMEILRRISMPTILRIPRQVAAYGANFHSHDTDARSIRGPAPRPTAPTCAPKWGPLYQALLSRSSYSQYIIVTPFCSSSTATCA